MIHHRTLKAAKREVCPLAAKVGTVLKTLTRWRQDAYAEYRCAEETGKLLQMAELNAMVQVYDACRQLVMAVLEEDGAGTPCAGGR